MYTTTPQYDSAIYANAREFKAKLEFEIVDVDAYADAGTLTVTGENAISQKAQTTDLVRNLSGKYATFEEDYWLLDGTFVLPPKTAELASFQTGWWSAAQSQADTTFAASQVYTKNFLASQDMIGITVTFDQETDEYAEDFTIQVYSDAGITLIDSDTVTGNTLSKYIWEANLSSVLQVVITITKWKTAYRFARVTEVDWGIIKEYTDDDLFQLNAIIEVDPLSSKVASDEISFILDNSSQEFNILNPTGIYPFLQKRQKIKPYYGLVINDTTTEWIPLGDFFLTEWNSDQGSLTASFKARDLLDIMAQTKYRKGKVQSRTITNLLTDVFTDFGLSASDYNIDSALDLITVNGNIPVLSYKSAIQIIANAGQAVVYIDRNNIVQVKQLTATASVDTIDFDNAFSIPKIILDKRINTAEIAINEYTSKPASEVVFDGTIYVDGTVDIWIEYKEFPATSLSSVITGEDSINSETYYGNAALINVTKAVAGNITIVTTGTIQERAESIFSKADASIGASEDIISIKLNNPLITTSAIAEDVADWILAEKQERFINDINWRMNPAHEVTDRVIVEDDFSVDKTARIYKNEFRYNGGLSGRTMTKGGS